ncbi:MAG TPA: hypothetical protein VMA36_07640 [Candidatus Limnocylindria bacterium]|nr:hypothetical protein [Candidatus Limnocylindria bacterium]
MVYRSAEEGGPMSSCALEKDGEMMNAVQSLIGFVPDAFARQMGASPAVGIELPLEPGSDVIVRIRHTHIEEARVGPSSGGYTGLQLILKPNATYELFASVSTSDESRAPVFDPAFWQRLLWMRRLIFTGPPIFRPDASGRFQELER